MTLHDMHCVRCDWDGYTDEPNGECPGCHTRGCLVLNDTSPEWDDDDWGGFDPMDEDPGM